MKAKACVSVFLYLEKDNKILLSLRQNTGHEDNKWSFVAGHVDVGESAKHALIREVFEEVGVNLAYENLDVVHVMHIKTDKEYVNFFITCPFTNQAFVNQEPHKCGGLEFFDINNLPLNTINYIRHAVACIQKKISYSEFGWEQSYNLEKLGTVR